MLISTKMIWKWIDDDDGRYNDGDGRYDDDDDDNEDGDDIIIESLYLDEMIMIMMAVKMRIKLIKNYYGSNDYYDGDNACDDDDF